MPVADDTVGPTSSADLARPELPPTLVDRVRTIGLRLGVEVRPARLAAVAVSVVAVIVAATWLLRPPAAPAPELTLPRAGGDVSPGATASSVTAAGVVAHAAGAVANPGLYHLAADARVADLITAAGGAAPDADLDRVNLAAKVADGERVYVPVRGEAVPEGVDATPPGASTAPLDLNTATAEQLDGLPGIGPAIARAIVEHRTKHGPFQRVDDLLDVRGIGEAKLAELRELVTVG